MKNFLIFLFLLCVTVTNAQILKSSSIMELDTMDYSKPCEFCSEWRYSRVDKSLYRFDRVSETWESYSIADGNGIISALPLGDVRINTSNHLYFRTLGGNTGTDIYTGGATFLKTATGNYGANLFLADTFGLDFALGWQQDDRSIIQNGGKGRQIVQLLTDYNPTVVFRWVSGVRLDTTSSVHVIRIMSGDRYANEAYPTEHIFNAALSPGSSASAYNFRTAHSVNRLSLNFDNGIYLRKGTKFFLEADSTFSYDFASNTQRLSAYGAGTKTATALGKVQSGYLATFATDGTVLDGPRIFTGTGSPETVITAPVGSIYTNTSGGPGTTLYIKESGIGNTGWVAK